MDAATKEHLHSQLIKLGDMMGDGLHNEPDGKWISREYKKVCRALGYIKAKPRRTDLINERMKERVAVAEMLGEEGISLQRTPGMILDKKQKVEKYMAYSRELGTLEI